ncbi:MAG: CpsD/CapB family tyrosine-protein kinase [Thermoanaerobaculia bacterium]
MDLPLRSDRSPRLDNVEKMPMAARPAVRLKEDAPLFLHLDPPSFAAEQYRTLAVQVEERLNPIGTWGYVLTVTSPEEGAGKTLTSLNLALTLTRGEERRVLLIEADLWRPKLHSYLHGERDTGRGLRQVLEREAALSEVTVPVANTSLSLLLSGSSDVAGDLISGRRMSEVLTEARSAYEIVVIDSPPMAYLASARALAARSDGAVVVVRAGKTPRRAIEKTLATLGPEKTIGLVLNGVRMSKRSYRQYY